MRMASARTAHSSASPLPRDWIQILVTGLPGLAAILALIFTWLSINATTHATNDQLHIAEQGQITDR